MDNDASRDSIHVGSRSYTAPIEGDLDHLRELLFGEELRDLAELRRRLDELGFTPDELAENLPAAVVLRSRRDKQLARALAPTIEDGLHEAVRSNPQKITDAIFPILGPAIRKSISETMAGLVQTINRGIENSISPRGLRWRFEAWRTGVPYGQVVIKHALVYRVEQIFLIHGETGILLAHVTADGVQTPDADLVYSMLTAIKDFVQDSFKAVTTNGMRRLTVGDHVIFAQQGPRAVVGAVVRGQAPESLNDRLVNILERIHLQYDGELQTFDGNITPFASATSYLEEGLETALKTEQPGKKSLTPRVMLALAIALLLALGYVYVRGALRWRQGVQALTNTPGIVVIESDRRLGTSKIRGLLDPDATSPEAVLAAYNLDTSRIATVWEPYVSADTAIIRRRVARMLGAPVGVQWQFVADTARASGAAPSRWITTANKLAAVPGVAFLDVTAVALQIPDSLVALQNELQQRRVDFSSGSTALTPRTAPQLDSVATIIRRILQQSTAEGLATTITLTGRADALGTPETNNAISQRRAEVVRDALLARGLTNAYYEATGVGASDPIIASPTAIEDANRSVALTVRFALALPPGAPAR